MSEKKVVGRNVAIALGIICIILAVGLVGAIAVYTSTINDKNNTINSLDSSIATRNSQILNLTYEVLNLNDIVNLRNSTVWVNNQTVSQPANSYTSWTFSASYAGFVMVNVPMSTTTNTYVEVIYFSYCGTYDQKITVGASGTAWFPVLPTSENIGSLASPYVEIRVGNTNLNNGATELVTITYHY